MSDDMEKLRALVEQAKMLPDPKTQIGIDLVVNTVKELASLDLSRIAAAVVLADLMDEMEKSWQTETGKTYAVTIDSEAAEAEMQERANKALAAYRAARGQQ